MLSLQATVGVKIPSLLLLQKRTVFPRKTKKPRKPAWMPRAVTEHRPPSACTEFPFKHPEAKPCFDISSVLVEQGNACHEKIVRSFLYTHYWPREPSTVGMYLSLCSPYLAALTEKYATSGDRWLAFERLPRTKERRPVGVLQADKIYPWVADEFEHWGNNCTLLPERHNMYFRAHCIRSPNVFETFHVPYSYNIEVLATAADVTGQGVAILLMRAAILRAMEHRHPLIQILSKSDYTHSVCERVGLKRAWDMQYTDFVDLAGQCLFYPRRPHKTVALYVRKFDEREGSVPENWKDPELFAVYRKICLDKETDTAKEKRCNTRGNAATEFPLFPRCQT